MNWQPEQDAIVRDLWGKHGCKYIAATIGVSRNAVIGRAHRLGLGETRGPRKPKVVREKRVRIVKAYTPRVHIRQAKPIVPKPSPIEPLNVGFFDLAHCHCHYPDDGEGLAMKFCGHPTIKGSSYCAWHNSVTLRQAA
jgi:GcrA cell cycle regulator